MSADNCTVVAPYGKHKWGVWTNQSMSSMEDGWRPYRLPDIAFFRKSRALRNAIELNYKEYHEYGVVTID